MTRLSPLPDTANLPAPSVLTSYLPLAAGHVAGHQHPRHGYVIASGDFGVNDTTLETGPVSSGFQSPRSQDGFTCLLEGVLEGGLVPPDTLCDGLHGS